MFAWYAFAWQSFAGPFAQICLSCHPSLPARMCQLLYIPMAASSSKYICFQPHFATFLSPSPHLLINTSFAAPYSTFRSSHHWWLVDVARLCREWNRQYCVFWDEGVVNISRTPQMLSISGFPAWENNEQENKTYLAYCCLKIEQKRGFLLQKYYFRIKVLINFGSCTGL